MDPRHGWPLPAEENLGTNPPPQPEPHPSLLLQPSAVDRGKQPVQEHNYTNDGQYLSEAPDWTTQFQPAPFPFPSQYPSTGVGPVGGVYGLGDATGFGQYYGTVGQDALAAGVIGYEGVAIGGMIPTAPMQVHPQLQLAGADQFAIGAEQAADAMMKAEQALERKKQRMIKNRESAARSRARKQAYDAQLAQRVETLKKENEKLKKELTFDQPDAPILMEKGLPKHLRRTRSV